MRLVIGGAYQGKKDYVKAKYRVEDDRIRPGKYPVQTEGMSCINGLHNIIREMMDPARPVDEQEETIWRYIRGLTRDCPDLILICDEVGGGIVPIEKAQRDYRECVGRMLCKLADEAETVERVCCGVGQTIKRTVRIAFVRHGATRGNLEKRYVGTTDEALCEEGAAEIESFRQDGLYPKVRQVFTSPLKRCVQTAAQIYPDLEPQTVEAFRETDFGLFEYRNYEKLMSSEKYRDRYQAWIDSGGRDPFPQGESMKQTADRCGQAFERLLPTLAADAAFIVHGGVIMGILGRYAQPRRDPYEYRCANGTGYLCKAEITGDGSLHRMTIEKRIGRI